MGLDSLVGSTHRVPPPSDFEMFVNKDGPGEKIRLAAQRPKKLPGFHLHRFSQDSIL
jgi:hypothetical protein